jgi:hypothetical protein
MNLAKGLHPRLDESLYQEAGFQPADCVWRRDGYLDLAMTIIPLAVVETAAPLASTERLKLPEGVRPFRLNWPNILVISAYHGPRSQPSCPSTSAGAAC